MSGPASGSPGLAILIQVRKVGRVRNTKVPRIFARYCSGGRVHSLVSSWAAQHHSHSLTRTFSGTMAKPQVGDKVLVIGHETWGPAIVRFLGETEFRAGIWAGVEYPTGVGNTNGTVNGIRYFKCPRRHGLFVTPNLIAPAPMRGDDDTIDATTVEGIEKLGRQLSDAAFIGNVDDVVRLLDQGAPIDWPDRANHDRTPLHYAWYDGVQCCSSSQLLEQSTECSMMSQLSR